jgi:hypothetical protein
MEKETLTTVGGVILLGVSYGLTLSYIINKDIGTLSAENILPFGMNLAVLIYIAYGLFSVSRLSLGVRVAILLFFVFLTTYEMYLMSQKPTTWYGIPIAGIVTTVGALVRLYLIISMHCDLPTSMFVTLAKQVVEPSKVTVEPRVERLPEAKPVAPFDRVNQLLSDALKKDNSKLTPEEIVEQKNKLRALYGLEPKVAMSGGRRR